MSEHDASRAHGDWFFEDFPVGATIETAGRTITETDIVMIVAITGHSQPLFIDEEFARTTAFGTRIAPIELTIGVMAGLLTRRGVLDNQIGLLEFSCKAPNPVRAGDTLRAVASVVSVRLTSKLDRGVVTFNDRLSNQRGECVLEARRAGMFLTRNR